MRLAAYLKREGCSYTEFARRIGTRHGRTVERYAKGLQRPHAEMMRRIVVETGGDVTPNDFFDLGPSESDATANSAGFSNASARA